MVQTSQKGDIHRRILQAARGEFLQKGFKDTSMRTISRLSGVTLSNIYNYFRDKDDIFRAVLTPLLNAFEQLFAEHNSDDYMSKEFFSMDSHQKKLIDDFMVIPTNYRTELKILLFNSAGSSLENFRDTFVDRYTQESLRYMKLMKERYPHIKADFSDFFLAFDVLTLADGDGRNRNARRIDRCRYQTVYYGIHHFRYCRMESFDEDMNKIFF